MKRQTKDKMPQSATTGAAARLLGCVGVCLMALGAIADSDQSTSAADAPAHSVVPTLSSFPQGQNSNFLPFADLRHSATGGESAKTQAKAAPFHLHGDNILDFGGLLADAANDNDNAFDNFYKKAQLRLFSSLDAALSQQAEDALFSQFNAIQKAKVEVQTSLGGRKGNVGLDLIGALAHGKRDGDEHAVGWQVRAYGDNDNARGGNLGIFYRRANDHRMLGINAFADYERGDYGGFSRYSFGGEWQNAYMGFTGNYYIPIIGDREINSTVVAFSREGYDLQMLLGVPQIDIFKAALDYYHFKGKSESDTKSDRGFRFGVKAHFPSNFRVDVLYDSNGDEIGGNIAYSHTIGEAQSRRGGGGAFAPDLYAAVSREYSQRIALATLGMMDYLVPLPGAGGLTVGVEGVVATVIASAGLIGGAPSGGFRFDGNSVLFSASMATNFAQSLTLTTATSMTVTSVLDIRATDMPITGDIQTTTGNLFLQGTRGMFPINLRGGHLTMADYSINLMQSGGAFSRNGSTLVFESAAPITAIATIVADDNNDRTMPVSLFFTATAVGTLSADITNDTRSFLTSMIGTVGSLAVAGGIGEYTYASSNGEVVVDGNGVIVMNAQSAPRSLVAVITIDDTNTPLTSPLSITMTLAVVSAVALVRDGVRDGPLVVGRQVPVVTIVLPGGGVAGSLPTSGNLAFSISANVIFASASAPVANSVQAITITSASQSVIISVPVNAQAAPAIDGSFGGYYSSVFLINFNGTVGTVSASGGDGALTYTMLPANSGFTRDAASGQVRFSGGNVGTVSLTIVIDDTGNERTTPASILLTVNAVDVCHFVSACLGLGYTGTGPLPSPSLASLMLRAGADVNDTRGSGVPSGQQWGMIDQIVDARFGNDRGDSMQFTAIVEFLVAHGSSINFTRTGTGTEPGTALDRYNDTLTPRGAARKQVLRDQGARCNIRCGINDRNLNGDLCRRNTNGAGMDCTVLPLGGSLPIHSSVFVPNFLGTVGTPTATGGSGSGYTAALDGSRSDSEFALQNGQLRVFADNSRIGASLTAVMAISDSNASTVSVSVTVRIIGSIDCHFADGCAALGHQSNTIPPLSVATMMARAGVDVNTTSGSQNLTGTQAHLIFQFANLHYEQSTGTIDDFLNIVDFLTERGVDINAFRTGVSLGEARTMLDLYNANFGRRDNAQQKAALRSRGAQCNEICGIGDTKTPGGEVCTANTTTAAQDCTP